MRDNNLLPPIQVSDDYQLSLPFNDEMPPPERQPSTTRMVLDLRDRRGRAYELIVRQDPLTRCVLSYCLRPITVH